MTASVGAPQLRARVIVVGSANVDTTILVSRIPAPGETVVGREVHRGAGGKGLNQAVAAARTGSVEVTFVGCIGDDAEGALVAAALLADGILPALRVDRDEPTGRATILLEPDGENAIVVTAGANAKFEADIVQPELTLDETTVILFQGECPLDPMTRIAKRAKRAGGMVILNAAPVTQISEEFLELVDVLVLNEIEARQLLMNVSQSATSSDPGQLLRWVETVIVTLGAEGVTVNRRGSRRIHVPAFAVQALDTTAAGDTFCGTLAGALSAGKTIEAATYVASAAAAIAVTRHGASDAIPRRDEVEMLCETRDGEAEERRRR